MKLALVGVGDAGGRVVNRIREFEHESDRNFTKGNSLIVNSEPTTFEAAHHVPENRRLLIGDTDPQVNGNGVDGDLDLGVSVAESDRNEIYRAFDDLEMVDMDAVLVVAGLGGGTGGGAGAVVLDALTTVFEHPVYGLGILPADDDGAGPALNAARALRTIVPTADNVILFDNDAWQDDSSEDEVRYDRVNRALAERLVTVFAGGEFDIATVAENKLDPSDLMRTLATGGVSSIGFASREVSTTGSGLLSWFRSTDDPEDPTDAATVKRLVRQAATSQLTLPCAIESTDRALVVLSGPPETLSRKGFEEARYWLEDAADTVEVLAGDEPREGASTLTAGVLFSNVTDVPRIEAIQERGLQSRERLVK